MKVIRTITIDVDVLARLRSSKINLSQLINTYLRNYLELGPLKDKQSYDDINKTKQEITKRSVELVQMQEKLSALEKKYRGTPPIEGY